MMEKGGEGYWTGERLVELYEKASKGREELARRGIVDALKVSQDYLRSESSCPVLRQFTGRHINNPTHPPPHVSPRFDLLQIPLSLPRRTAAKQAFSRSISRSAGSGVGIEEAGAGGRGTGP